MLNNLISNICRLEIRILPLGTMPNAPYIDLLTLLFCISILILTLAIATNRRKFHLIFQSLFSQRVRAQFSREIKLFEDWIYPILLVYIFSVQATFVFLLLQYFIPNVSHSFLPIALYGISFGVVILDYFLKELNVVILSYLFDYKEEKNYFYQNKFFYLTINSIVLLPILIVASYTGLKAILSVFCRSSASPEVQ